MKVCKFGGSSLADAGQLEKVARIVAADRARRIVVVSAPGKRHEDDIKVTDLLLELAARCLKGADTTAERRAVVARYAGIQKALGLPCDVVVTIERDLKDRAEQVSQMPREQFLDLMKAAGEDNMAKLVADVLTHRGHPAEYTDPRDAGMILSDEYGNARVLESSYEKLSHLRERDSIVVFPGFFGYTANGRVVTFSRGGSDITGSILAAATRAEVYENFTDVDSVYAADPRIVPNAAPIEELTYREMRELSYAGFGVLHDEAIIPAVSAGVPICIKNTNRPQAPGTRIVPEHMGTSHRVVGIASDDGFCTIMMSKYLMNREVGFGRQMLQILEEEGLSYEHSPSGIDNVSLVLRSELVTPEVEQRLVDRFENEMGCSDIVVERDLALIMIVGEGMRYQVGVSAAATRALADAGVNIELINQGASEISIMFGVKGKSRRQAVEALYRAFFDAYEATSRG